MRLEAGRQEGAACKPEQLREASARHPVPGVLTGHRPLQIEKHRIHWEESEIFVSTQKLGRYICIPKAFLHKSSL